MVDPSTVAEVHCRDQLAEVMPGAVLLEAAVLGDPGEELAAPHELHGEVDLGFGGHDLVELDDVWVGDHLHHRDLSLHLLGHPDADHLLLRHDLHGDVAAGAEVAGEVDLGEGAVAEEAAELVPALEDVATGGGRGGGRSNFFHWWGVFFWKFLERERERERERVKREGRGRVDRGRGYPSSTCLRWHVRQAGFFRRLPPRSGFDLLILWHSLERERGREGEDLRREKVQTKEDSRERGREEWLMS